MTDANAALVLFSGGQDSTTSLFWAKARWAHVEALVFRYGQRHAVEVEQARKIAREAGVPLTEMDISGTLGGSALTESTSDISAAHPRNPDLPASFVPGRNAVFLTLAGSLAYTKGIHDIVSGMCQADFSGYPDCRRVFVDSMEATLSLALDTEIYIHTPLMDLSKAETWKLAFDLGPEVFEIVRRDSHTDYNGNRAVWNPWGYGALDNPASILRAKGFEEAVSRGWIPG